MSHLLRNSSRSDPALISPRVNALLKVSQRYLRQTATVSVARMTRKRRNVFVAWCRPTESYRVNYVGCHTKEVTLQTQPRQGNCRTAIKLIHKTNQDKCAINAIFTHVEYFQREFLTRSIRFRYIL